MSDSVPELLNEAWSAFARGDETAADALIDRAVEADPLAVAAWMERDVARLQALSAFTRQDGGSNE
jgi:hypothetical protein